jgi:hypothetical protein
LVFVVGLLILTQVVFSLIQLSWFGEMFVQKQQPEGTLHAAEDK